MSLFDDAWFDGETYDHERDGRRLGKQAQAVWDAMVGGQWRTLADLSRITGHPEASVSARLRDFRKRRFGSHELESEYVDKGLWRYRLHPRRESKE